MARWLPLPTHCKDCYPRTLRHRVCQVNRTVLWLGLATAFLVSIRRREFGMHVYPDVPLIEVQLTLRAPTFAARIRSPHLRFQRSRTPPMDHGQLDWLRRPQHLLGIRARLERYATSERRSPHAGAQLRVGWRTLKRAATRRPLQQAVRVFLGVPERGALHRRVQRVSPSQPRPQQRL